MIPTLTSYLIGWVIWQRLYTSRQKNVYSSVLVELCTSEFSTFLEKEREHCRQPGRPLSAADSAPADFISVSSSSASLSGKTQGTLKSAVLIDLGLSLFRLFLLPHFVGSLSTGAVATTATTATTSGWEALPAASQYGDNVIGTGSSTDDLWAGCSGDETVFDE